MSFASFCSKLSVELDNCPLLCLLQVDFADVIAEPGGIHSLKLVWIISHNIYKYSKKLLYILLSALLGIVLSLIWGLVFAFLAFGNIWVVVPCIKCCKVTFHCLISPFIKCMKSCFKPGCNAVALALRTLRVIFRKDAWISLDIWCHLKL